MEKEKAEEKESDEHDEIILFLSPSPPQFLLYSPAVPSTFRVFMA